MAFSFEWTGRQFGDDADYQKGYDAAADYCGEHSISPARTYAAIAAAYANDAEPQEADLDEWAAIETAAFAAAFDGWQKWPENVCLVWQ